MKTTCLLNSVVDGCHLVSQEPEVIRVEDWEHISVAMLVSQSCALQLIHYSNQGISYNRRLVAGRKQWRVLIIVHDTYTISSLVGRQRRESRGNRSAHSR